jgi:CHAT domain-containing protein/tetratricopeptide (TPR) repeat protein
MKTFFCIILLLVSGMAYSQNGYKLITKALKEINSEIDEKNFGKALEVAFMADSLFKKTEETETPEYAYLKRITGFIYSEKGEKAAADTNYTEAIRLYREYTHGADPYFILALSEYSALLTKEKRYVEAEPFLIEAIELQKDGKEKEGTAYAYTLYNLGSLYFETGRYIEAESVLKEAMGLKRIKASEFREYYPLLLSLLAEVYDKTENYQAAIDLYKDALNDVRKSEAEQNAYFLAKLGQVYVELSQFSLAEPLFKEAIQIEKSAGREKSENYALYLSELATLYRETSKYDKSLDLYKEALHLQESEQYDVFDTYFNLSQLYTLMADYAAAEEMAVKTISKAEMEEKNSYAYLSYLNLIGNLYTLTGSYNKAEKSYLEIIEKGKKLYGEQSTDYAISIDNLVNLYLLTGKEKTARPLVFRALEIKKKNLGELSIEVAYSLNNLSSICQAEGNFTEAADYQKQVLEIYKKCLGEENSDFAGAMLSLASVYINEKRYSGAEILVKRAIAIIGNKTGVNHPLYANSLNFLADLYVLTGRPDSAEVLYLKVNDNRLYQIKRNFSYLAEKEKEEFISTFSADFGRFNSFVYNRKLRNPSLTGVAYDNQLALKGIVLQSSRSFRQAVLNSGDKTLTDLYERMNSIRSLLLEQEKLTPVQQWINTDSLENISVKLEKELSGKLKVLPAFATFSMFDNSVRWQDVQNSIGDKEAAIEFVSTGDDTIRYYALVLRAGMKYPEMVGLFNENELNGIIEKNKSGNYVNADRLYKFSKGDGLPGSYKNLYDIIWKPMEIYLKGVEKIYYSPAGLLNLISFDAIPCSENSYLSDRYKLVAVTSTREVVKKTDEMFHSSENLKVVFYGGINYDSDTSRMKSQRNILNSQGTPSRARFRGNDQLRGSGFMFLDGTLSEVQKIEPLLSKRNIPTVVFSGDEATEESFKSLNNLNSPVCLHIATHGFFFPQPAVLHQIQGTRSGSSENICRTAENPLFRSGLIFAGGNHVWKNEEIPAGVEDGIILASEVAEMYLPNTRLVVLSACETGLGEIKGSEGVFGLQRSFKMAGAGFMIISLWEVPDYQTSELMNKFYENWISGQTIHDAFGNARNFMKTKYPGMPSTWAAFVLVT